ncbi:hypothetical protein [Halostella salina]|uniref:hypothetical protein n=1 Tax=Halostella salina TaxID=1547897 RepID=UPI000EF76B7E|nr:hypothetical protein [Halostella salina]
MSNRTDDGPDEPNEVRVDWYSGGSEDRIAVGIDAGDVRLAVTFPVTASRAELESVFAERDRELDHYFESLARVRSESRQRTVEVDGGDTTTVEER